MNNLINPPQQKHNKTHTNQPQNKNNPNKPKPIKQTLPTHTPNPKLKQTPNNKNIMNKKSKPKIHKYPTKENKHQTQNTQQTNTTKKDHTK